MTTTRTISTIAVLCFLAGTSAFGEGRPTVGPMSPVTAKLTIPDARVLPGVPFDMWIEISNPSDASVAVGLCADMLVRPEQGEPFTAALPPRNSEDMRPDYPVLLPEYDMSGPSVTYLVLKPRQRQTLTIPILPALTGPAYFADPRLSAPGRYAISLRLDYCWPAFAIPQKSQQPPAFLGAVTTNEVTVERITPEGPDAVVWQRMQELAEGRWSSTGWKTTEPGWIMTKEILTNDRDSNYVPYALLVSPSADALFDAIQRFPDSPVLELLHRAAAITAHGPRAAAEWAVAHASKRPTTRILIFGREDVQRPCRPDHDCSEP